MLASLLKSMAKCDLGNELVQRSQLSKLTAVLQSQYGRVISDGVIERLNTLSLGSENPKPCPQSANPKQRDAKRA